MALCRATKFFQGTKVVAEPKFRKIMRKLKDYFLTTRKLFMRLKNKEDRGIDMKKITFGQY